MSTKIFQTFVDKWIGNDERMPVSRSRIDALEDLLGTTLPSAYREFMTTVGAVSVPVALLSSIVDQQLDVADVQDFYDPENVLSATRAWRKMGLPENLFAVASDSSGNQFCLAIPDIGEAVDDDASIWFFDHEEPEAYDMEVPFTKWIETYANIENTAPAL